MTRDVSEIMRRVRSRDTKPEMVFRKELWQNGMRYKLCPQDIPGKPDIVVPSKKLAIFVDGDFWHGGQWSRRNLSSLESQFVKTPSRDYWLTKIRKNVERDCRSTAVLLSEGWQVLRFWESDIKKNIDRCVRLTLDVASNASIQTPFAFAPQKTFAEFFAGIGLVRLALERQGWRVAYANDIDPKKHAMYASQFDDSRELYDVCDIHKISGDIIPNVTLATVSFPCNDLSLAGSRAGLSGKGSSAFWGFIRLITDMDRRRPPIIMLENVVGFLTSNKGNDFRDALVALNNLGYLVDAFIIDASSFVPQSRSRLFVVAELADMADSLTDKIDSSIRESRIRPKKLIDFVHNHAEIRWRIKNLPEIEDSGLKLTDILEDLPDEAPEWWSPERANYLLSQMNVRHRKLAETMISGSDWSYGVAFRRIRAGASMAELRTDGIAGCLRTPRGGSARQILVKAGKGKFLVRLLTPREYARLMGADDYKISVSTTQAFFGFGDAVCVPVMEWIATHRLNPLVTELIRGRPLFLGDAANTI